MKGEPSERTRYRRRQRNLAEQDEVERIADLERRAARLEATARGLQADAYRFWLQAQALRELAAPMTERSPPAACVMLRSELRDVAVGTPTPHLARRQGA